MNRDRHESLIRRIVFGLAVGSAAIVGCSAEVPRESKPSNNASEKSTADGDVSNGSDHTAGVPTQVTLALNVTPVDRNGLDSTIAKCKGKVVLVDFWATWCLPCVEQLPHTLDLGRRLADRGLVVVTVSCDEPADADQVAQFLTLKQANGAVNLISLFGGSPKSMEEFEISTGAVPFYKLYDRSGELRQMFGINPSAKKQYTTADIDAAVENLLEK